MILKKFLGPLDKLEAEIFYIHKIIKIVIIFKNKNLVFATFQIILPSFEYYNNIQQLAIIDFVSNFYKNYFLKKKYY